MCRGSQKVWNGIMLPGQEGVKGEESRINGKVLINTYECQGLLRIILTHWSSSDIKWLRAIFSQACLVCKCTICHLATPLVQLFSVALLKHIQFPTCSVHTKEKQRTWQSYTGVSAWRRSRAFVRSVYMYQWTLWKWSLWSGQLRYAEFLIHGQEMLYTSVSLKLLFYGTHLGKYWFEIWVLPIWFLVTSTMLHRAVVFKLEFQ